MSTLDPDLITHAGWRFCQPAWCRSTTLQRITNMPGDAGAPLLRRIRCDLRRGHPGMHTHQLPDVPLRRDEQTFANGGRVKQVQTGTQAGATYAWPPAIIRAAWTLHGWLHRG